MRKLLLIIFALLAWPGFSLAGPPEKMAQLEVLPGWRAADGTHIVGLRITLAPGWKTYWRAPGDAGIPPVFALAGSDNITGFTPHWPVPQLFLQGNMVTVGYADAVVFPLTLHSQDATASMRLKGALHIGACEEICIPVTLPFDITLPPAGSQDPAITAALINRPLTAAEAGIGPVTCALNPIDDGLRMTVSIDLGAQGPTELAVIEASNPEIWVSPAQISRAGDRLLATADLVHVAGNSFALDRGGVRITLFGAHGAIDIQGCDKG